jgi:predicted dehydrogenase
LEITGSEGTVILENDRMVSADLRTRPQELVSGERDGQSPSASSPVVNDVRGHRSAIEDFIRAVEKDETPACDGRTAQRSVALIERIYQASQQFSKNRNAELAIPHR